MIENLQKINLSESTELCEIMGIFGSDKGHKDIMSSWHNYTILYHTLFKDIRNKNLNIFELGLGSNNLNIPSNMGINGKPGASLYGWAEYFKNSSIYGADIDKGILFNNNRIKTFYCDQTDKEIIKNMWDNEDLQINFDIIIEDGLHEFNANCCFFEHSIHKLNTGGFYIIEDISKENLNLFNDKINEWKEKYKNFEFYLISLFSNRNTFDNNLLLIKRN